MDYIFSDEDKEDLIERGFNNGQIEFLESLEMEPNNLYLNICKTMDDFGDSPSAIIVDYEQANGIPTTGGKRKRKRKRRSSTRKTTKRNKKSRKSRKIRKSRKNRR